MQKNDDFSIFSHVETYFNMFSVPYFLLRLLLLLLLTVHNTLYIHSFFKENKGKLAMARLQQYEQLGPRPKMQNSQNYFLYTPEIRIRA